MCNLEVAMHRC